MFCGNKADIILGFHLNDCHIWSHADIQSLALIVKTQNTELICHLTLSPLSYKMDSFISKIWSHPLLQIGVSVKNDNRMTHSVDPDEMAHYELSHLDLHWLHRYMFWSARLKRSRRMDTLSVEAAMLNCFCLPSEKLKRNLILGAILSF